MINETMNVNVEGVGRKHGVSRRGFVWTALGGAMAGLSGALTVMGAESPEGAGSVNPRLFTFVGGDSGRWNVISARAIVGEPLPLVAKLDIVNGAVAALPAGAKWSLRGVTSNARYVNRDEKERLSQIQAPLGRQEATHAALIPIRKTAKWWDLTQDERRAIFEETSKHNAIGMKYLPAIARRLHHCRDLGEVEPFDFLTLFDFAKSDVNAFDDLLAALRATEEWKYVEREVDIRLERVAS